MRLPSTVTASPRESSSSSADDDFVIPLSAIQHAIYCLRQAALIHVERLWEENRFTAEGRVQHEAVDRQEERFLRGVRRVTGMPIACRRLGLAGVADVVEFHGGPEGEAPYPVEFKRGKPKRHRADEAQLCAQALCLEEMTGKPIPEGALYYQLTRRRVVVPFDETLRAMTERAASEFRSLVVAGRTPPAVYDKRKCAACSLLDLCQPKLSGRSALKWRDRALDEMLESETPG
jgi:CRISPR-associated exonuclease Cas4